MKVKVKVLQIPTVFTGRAATEDGAGDALRKAVVVVHVETWMGQRTNRSKILPQLMGRSINGGIYGDLMMVNAD